MISRRILPVLAMLVSPLFAGCVYHDAYTFDFELRSHSPLPFVKVDVCTDGEGSSGMKADSSAKPIDGFTHFGPGQVVIWDNYPRYAVFVRTDGLKSQVFQLPDKTVFLASEWSEWIRPDYEDVSPNGSGQFYFIYGETAEHTQAVHTDAFELRYRVKKLEGVHVP